MFWWCGVLLCLLGCVLGCVLCCVCGVWCVARLGTRKNPCVQVQNVSVCRFKTLPCVPAKRAQVLNMRAFCRYTRKRLEPTHGDVLNLHTERRERVLLSLSRPFSLSLLSFFFLSSVVLPSLLLSFSALFSLLSCLLSLLSQQQ